MNYKLFDHQFRMPTGLPLGSIDIKSQHFFGKFLFSTFFYI